MKKILLISFLISFFKVEAQNLDSSSIDNFYQVSRDLYRSGQPTKKDFIILDSIGFNTVISLRNRVSDKNRAKHTSIITHRYRINTWKMDYDDILTVLKAIKNAETPTLVHCLHGSDRTGVIVASYRMTFHNWTKEKAIEEFLQPQYGYHQNWFPSLLELLEDLDIKKLKSDLGIN